MDRTEKPDFDARYNDYSASDVEPLRPEMAFLAENPEAFGLVPDACPLATKHLLVAVNGHSAEGGVLSPVCEMQQPGIDGLLALYGDLLPHDEGTLEALTSAFGENTSTREYPVSKYCATLTAVTTMNLLRGELKNASFDETRARLEAGIRDGLSSLENLFCQREDEDLRGSEFFSVSVGACRIREMGEGDYVAEIFAAGDFRIYLLDESGMAPLWHMDTPTLSPSNAEALRGEALRFHHPAPFAVLLVSESICALNAAEQRSLRSSPGLIWRYRMRLEDIFLRLVTDCVRDYEFGDRATRFFVGRSHGRDSASGAMTVLRNGISHETFRLHCQTRLSALGRLIELLPGGYDVQNVPAQESRTETEMAHIRGLLEQKPELSDRLTDALRRHALDKFRAGEGREVAALPADIPDYVRLEWQDIQKVYSVLDRENLEDRTRVAENTRILRECLSEHWITLRDVFTEPLDSEDALVQSHETVSERIFHSCLDLNRRLAEMLQERQATVLRLSEVLSSSLMTLEAEGNDWLCGRADADGMLAWARPLRREIREQVDHLEQNWRADTQRYRSLLTAYTAEREDLFRRDTRPGLGRFAEDWQAIRDGELSEDRWDTLRERLVKANGTAAYLETFDSVHRISRGTGILKNRIRSRAVENRMARELANRPELRMAALRGAAYEDSDWGDEVIAAMDTATRNEYRAMVRRWKENCLLIEQQKEAYQTYSTMYQTFTRRRKV